MGIKVNINGVNEILRRFKGIFASGLNITRLSFSTFVNERKFDLKFNGQAIYISEYLNQLYDPDLKRIYVIIDSTLFENYFYRTSEGILPEDQLYLYRTSETITADEQVYLDKSGFSTGVDFQVAVPLALSSLVTDQLFVANVRKYALPDKQFEVITY